MIWTPNGNNVSVLPPSPGDLFVVTTISGKRVFVEPVSKYESAIRTAEAFARATSQPRPFTVKVLCMTFGELIAHMGHKLEDYAKHLTPQDAEADRQAAIRICTELLRSCNESQVRADAFDILKELGVFQ